MPVPFFVGNIDRYPTYKGGEITERVVYANYIGLCISTDRWSTSVGGHLMKVVNLTGFTVYCVKKYGTVYR
jgi:hypothetical protein